MAKDKKKVTREEAMFRLRYDCFKEAVSLMTRAELEDMIILMDIAKDAIGLDAFIVECDRDAYHADMVTRAAAANRKLVQEAEKIYLRRMGSN